jgi:hypothetical protein
VVSWYIGGATVCTVAKTVMPRFMSLKQRICLSLSSTLRAGSAAASVHHMLRACTRAHRNTYAAGASRVCSCESILMTARPPASGACPAPAAASVALLMGCSRTLLSTSPCAQIAVDLGRQKPLLVADRGNVVEYPLSRLGSWAGLACLRRVTWLPPPRRACPLPGAGTCFNSA